MTTTAPGSPTRAPGAAAGGWRLARAVVEAPPPLAAAPDAPVLLFLPAHDEEEAIGACLAADAGDRRRPAARRRRHRRRLDRRHGGPGAGAGVEVVSLGTNHGLGAAVRIGLALGAARGAAAVVFCDADGEYPPEEIEALVGADPRRRGRLRRRQPVPRTHRPHASAPPRRQRRSSPRALSVVARRPISDGQSGYRAFSPAAAVAAEIVHDYNYAQVLTLDLLAKGFRYLEVPISYRFRTTGRSFVTLGRYLRHVVPAVYRELNAPPDPRTTGASRCAPAAPSPPSPSARPADCRRRLQRRRRCRRPRPRRDRGQRRCLRVGLGIGFRIGVGALRGRRPLRRRRRRRLGQRRRRAPPPPAPSLGDRHRRRAASPSRRTTRLCRRPSTATGPTSLEQVAQLQADDDDVHRRRPRRRHRRRQGGLPDLPPVVGAHRADRRADRGHRHGRRRPRGRLRRPDRPGLHRLAQARIPHLDGRRPLRGRPDRRPARRRPRSGWPTRCRTLELPPGVLTVGAQELIEEVAAPDGKLSGEEDRYSGHRPVRLPGQRRGLRGARSTCSSRRCEEADPELLAADPRGSSPSCTSHLAALGSFEDGFVPYAEVTEEQKAAAGRRPRRAGRVPVAAQRHAGLE